MNRRPVQLQRISRRGLISSAVLAGVLSATGVQVQARTRGGVLRLGLSAPTFAQVAAVTIYDTLTEITATGELTGELAESWEPSEAAAVWTVALRRGVPFHDGRVVTAADVVASFAAHRGLTPVLDAVTEMQVVGPQQIRFALAAPDANFPLRLADPQLTVAPEGRFDGIGSGLYRLAEEVPGERLRLARVAGHWRDGRAGWFDAVVLRVMPDPAARTAALLGGHVDAVDFPADAAAITARRNLHLLAAEGYGIALTDDESAAALAAGLAVVPGLPADPVVPVTATCGAGIGSGLYGLGLEVLTPGLPAVTAFAGHMPFTLAHADRLRHDAVGTMAPMDSGRIAERWWFA